MAVIGPDFTSLQVRDLEASARFYEQLLGLTRAAVSPPHAVVFETSPIAFAVRTLTPGVDLDSGTQPGLGVALWFAATGVQDIHSALVDSGATIVVEPFTGPFGLTFTFADPDGYHVTIHDAA